MTPSRTANLNPVRQIGGVLNRSRFPITLAAATYLIPVLLGIAAVTSGVPFALQQRDSIVNSAQGSPTIEAYHRGDRLEAALLDFGSNLAFVAGPTSIAGVSVIGPLPIAAYRGWVGGVVSVDSNHASRLSRPSDALYYLVTMVLQLAGFILAMAAGIHVGVAAWRARGDTGVRSIAGLRIPGWSLRDAAWLSVLVIPILLAGSLWEFLY